MYEQQAKIIKVGNSPPVTLAKMKSHDGSVFGSLADRRSEHNDLDGQAAKGTQAADLALPRRRNVAPIRSP